MSTAIRIVCKTGAMGASSEGAVIATIGDAVILWETPFKYQVHCLFVYCMSAFYVMLLWLNK